MAGPLTVEIHGYDELKHKLGAVAAKKVGRGVLTAALKEMEGYTAPYPPARPYTGRTWYERGYGTRWRRKDGSIHGRQTSQGLGRSWVTEIEADGLTGHLKNRATYAPFVHDADVQAGVHKGRWKTLQDAVKERGSAVVAMLREAIEDAWRG